MMVTGPSPSPGVAPSQRRSGSWISRRETKPRPRHLSPAAGPPGRPMATVWPVRPPSALHGRSSGSIELQGSVGSSHNPGHVGCPDCPRHRNEAARRCADRRDTDIFLAMITRWVWMLEYSCKPPEIRSAMTLNVKKANANVVVKLWAARGLFICIFIACSNLFVFFCIANE